MPASTQTAPGAGVFHCDGSRPIRSTPNEGTLDKNKQAMSCYRRRLIAWIVLIALSLGGCSENGPTRVAVSGRVTLDGLPLKWGTIMFVPEPGTHGPKTGAEITRGEFNLDRKQGPTVGTFRVVIRNDRQPRSHTPGVPKPETAKREPVVPPRYDQYSELRIETSESNRNYFQFKLTSEPLETY